MKKSQKNWNRHGMSFSPEYGAWHSMKDRCFNKNNKYFHNYGGRGITVCKKWLEFKNFFADMGKKPSSEHSLDRINNNKNYSPKNCRWATWIEQEGNRRDRKIIVFNNQSKSVSEWARIYDIPANTLWNRIFIYKWPLQKAFGMI